MCDIAIFTIYRDKQRFFSFSAIFPTFREKPAYFKTISAINRDILDYIIQNIAVYRENCFKNAVFRENSEKSRKTRKIAVCRGKW